MSFLLTPQTLNTVTKFTLVDVTVAVPLIGCNCQDVTGLLKYKSHLQTWQEILKY